jgi:mono/diheme cytochrome c family protein
MRTLIATAIFSSAFFGALAADKPTIKHVALTQTSAASGKEMFDTYCAVCHGAAARGDGPAAVALHQQPSDLTLLAARNGGKYPDLKVTEVLSAKDVGSHEMPAWGALFKSISHGDRDIVRMRILNLTSYIKSIQQ